MTHYDHEEWGSDASNIECPRCGESFFYELTRCPNCGLPVYADEADNDEFEEYEANESQDFLSEWVSEFARPAIVFFGLIVSFVVSTAVFFVFRFALGDAILSWPGRGILLFSAPIGAAAGGYVAAAMDKEKPRFIGGWIGGLSIISAIVLAGVDSAQVGGWFGAETIPLWLFTVLAGFFSAEFWRRQQRDLVVQQLFGDFPDEEVLYADLMEKIGYDEQRAERLIEFERQYMPNATRRTLIESAINRWERDNR